MGESGVISMCLFLWSRYTDIIPFSERGSFSANLVSEAVCFMVELRVGSLKG